MNRNTPKMVTGIAFSAVLLVLPVFMKIFVQNWWELTADIGIKVFLNVAFALCLWIMLLAGELSLGQGAFITVGAYVSGILATKYTFLDSVWLSCLAGAVVSGTFALALGSIIVHLRRIYFLLVTWAFGEMFRPLLISFQEPFGGATGIWGIPLPEGLSLFPEPWTGFYYVSLLFAWVVFLVIGRVSRSGVGLICRGIGQNDVLSSFCGIHVWRNKLEIFTMGCFFTGFGGGVLASYLTAVSPDTFTFFTSLDIIMFSLMGGMGHIAGPILGALVLTGVNELLFAAGYYRMIVYGLIVILIIRFLPGGIISLPATVGSRINGLRKGPGG